MLRSGAEVAGVELDGARTSVGGRSMAAIGGVSMGGDSTGEGQIHPMSRGARRELGRCGEGWDLSHEQGTQRADGTERTDDGTVVAQVGSVL